jgi:hypothetical protein
MNSDQYIYKAKELVSKTTYVQDYAEKNPSVNFPDPEFFYVVWFAKTLGNWKALVSTDVFDNVYWEVTHNGAKNETYVDTYFKHNNECFSG